MIWKNGDSCVNWFTKVVTLDWSTGSPACLWEGRKGVASILSCFPSATAFG